MLGCGQGAPTPASGNRPSNPPKRLRNSPRSPEEDCRNRPPLLSLSIVLLLRTVRLAQCSLPVLNRFVAANFVPTFARARPAGRARCTPLTPRTRGEQYNLGLNPASNMPANNLPAHVRGVARLSSRRLRARQRRCIFR